jgi:hypothetical protein
MLGETTVNYPSPSQATRDNMMMKKLQFHLGGIMFVTGIGCAIAPVSFEVFALFILSGFVLLLSSSGLLDRFWW